MLYFIIFFLIKTVLLFYAVQFEINQSLSNDEVIGQQSNTIIMEAVY